MRVFVVLLMGLLMCTAASAQSNAVAQINGTAKDQSGALLPGVDIKVTQTETGLDRSTVTDETGTYTLTNLPIGPYRLEASLPSFKTYAQTGIVLQVNSNPTIPVVLSVGEITETVQVEANAAMVETVSNAIGQVIDQQRLVDLPLNGRRITDLASLTGGAYVRNDLNASKG